MTDTTGFNPPPPLARVRRTSDFYEPLNLKQAYTRIETRGRTKVRDREAYVLVGYPAGDLPEELYFDVEDGLLLRKGTAMQMPLGYWRRQDRKGDADGGREGIRGRERELHRFRAFSGRNHARFPGSPVPSPLRDILSIVSYS